MGGASGYRKFRKVSCAMKYIEGVLRSETYPLSLTHISIVPGYDSIEVFVRWQK